MGYYWSPTWTATLAAASGDSVSSIRSVRSVRMVRPVRTVRSVEAAGLRGRPLRYLLVTLLLDAEDSLSVRDLITGCQDEGVTFNGRASKIISDALRWEVRSGRVRRVARGVYRSGQVPDSTRRWIGHRVTQLRVWLAWVHREPRRDRGHTPTDDDLHWWDWSQVSWVPGWPRWPAPIP